MNEINYEDLMNMFEMMRERDEVQPTTITDDTVFVSRPTQANQRVNCANNYGDVRDVLLEVLALLRQRFVVNDKELQQLKEALLGGLSPIESVYLVKRIIEGDLRE